MANKKESNGHFRYALFCLFAFMLVGLMLSVFIGQLIMRYCKLDESVGLMTTSVVQNICAFILPTIIVGIIYTENVWRFIYTNIDRRFSFKLLFGVAAIIFLMMPFMDWLINWNASVTLPDSFHNIELWLRQQEEAAQQTTNKILGMTGVSGLISMILTVGVITGIGEECFFRGGMQRILQQTINPHIAIWITAFIFSAIHLQFLGFVPRMLLGAFFGYLYFWSDSLWIPIFGHALNNSIVVWQTWKMNTTCLIYEQSHMPDYKSIMLSVFLTTIGLFLFRRYSMSLMHSNAIPQ